MTKSELIDKISASQDHLSPKDVELAIRMILERMTKTLANNDRIEIRGCLLQFFPAKLDDVNNDRLQEILSGLCILRC